MSRVFKSEQCVETAPCKLEPVILPINPVIPEQQADPDPPAVVFSDPAESEESLLNEARIQADALIRSAQKKADEIMKAANDEAEQIKAETYRSTFDAATQAARKTVKTEMAADLQKAAAVLNEAELLRAERIASSEPELLKLAVAIAKKIIAQELRLDDAAVRSIVGNALAKIAGATDIKIRLNPEDYEMLSTNDGLDFENVLGEPKPIRFEADPAISHGGCFIETEMGNVDARIKMQLETIMTELIKVGRFI